MTETDFYHVHDYADRLNPGDEIKIEHSVSFDEDRADLTDLTGLSLAALLELKKASAEQEQAIFVKLCAAVKEWEKQGANTMRIAKALEYVKTPEVGHTSNVWKKGEHDFYEISNMVYKMTYRIYERTEYDRTLKQSVPVAWEVTWDVGFNAPRQPGGYSYGSSTRQIAGQDRKLYRDKSAAEQYLQGRKDAYAELFTELSPPIPAQQKRLFTVNGQLLPGYTVEPERGAVVSELLEFLEDDDAPIIVPPPEKQAEKPQPTPHAKQKTRKPPSRAAPVR